MFAFAVAALIMFTGTPEEPGRWVDFGPWNGVVDCESSPTASGPPLSDKPEEARVDQKSPTSDYGAFQFQRATWDWVAQSRGRDDLVGIDPRSVSLGEQYQQALHLKKIGGIGHWTCDYRYGDGTDPRWVTAETPGFVLDCGTAWMLVLSYGFEEDIVFMSPYWSTDCMGV